MRKLIASAVSILTLVLTSAPAQAWWGCCCCAPPPCIQWVEQTVTCYRPQWQERDVVCTVMKPVYREEIVQQRCTVMVPVWTEQPASCIVPTYRPKVIEREVVCCRMVPVCVTDPCTGCTYTTCKPETYVQKVQCTVMECIPVRKDYTVKVCSFKPEERVYNVRRVHCDWKPEQVTYKERYCVPVAYQAKVMVPVCCP